MDNNLREMLPLHFCLTEVNFSCLIKVPLSNFFLLIHFAHCLIHVIVELVSQRIWIKIGWMLGQPLCDVVAYSVEFPSPVEKGMEERKAKLVSNGRMKEGLCPFLDTLDAHFPCQTRKLSGYSYPYSLLEIRMCPCVCLCMCVRSRVCVYVLCVRCVRCE